MNRPGIRALLAVTDDGVGPLGALHLQERQGVRRPELPIRIGQQDPAQVGAAERRLDAAADGGTVALVDGMVHRDDPAGIQAGKPIQDLPSPVGAAVVGDHDHMRNVGLPQRGQEIGHRAGEVLLLAVRRHHHRDAFGVATKLNQVRITERLRHGATSAGAERPSTGPSRHSLRRKITQLLTA